MVYKLIFLHIHGTVHLQEHAEHQHGLSHDHATKTNWTRTLAAEGERATDYHATEEPGLTNTICAFLV